MPGQLNEGVAIIPLTKGRLAASNVTLIYEIIVVVKGKVFFKC